MSEEIMDHIPEPETPAEQPEFAGPVEGEYNPIKQGDPHWLAKLDANGRYILGRIGDGEENLDGLKESIAQQMLQYDAECTFEDGVFALSDPPENAGDRFGVWFVAPEKFTRNSLIRVKSQHLPVFGPNLKPAATGCFAANALVYVGLDLASSRAFLAGGGSGGVALVSQTSISVMAGDAEATVTLSNQGASGFAGTLLVVKPGNIAPEDEKDGAAYDVGAASAYTITGLVNGTPYVVRAFAYDGDGEYQITTAGAIESFTPSNIPEDPPGNVTGFKGTPGQNGTIVLSWTDPANTALTEWAGTMIRRKVGDYPADETDGELVVDSKTRNQYQVMGCADSGLNMATTYFYQAFPYSTSGVFNRSEVNRISLVPKPESFKFLTVITKDTNWSAPVDGWYRVFVLGKSGDGAEGKFNSLSNGGQGSGGGGGGSGAVAASLLYYTQGTTVPISVTTGHTQFGASVDAEVIIAFAGANGSSGTSGTGGSNQTPGTVGIGGAGGAGGAIPTTGNLFKAAGAKGGNGGAGGVSGVHASNAKAGSAGGNSGARGGALPASTHPPTMTGGGGGGARYVIDSTKYPYIDPYMYESQSGGIGEASGYPSNQLGVGSSVLAVVNSSSLITQGGGSGGGGGRNSVNAGGKGNPGMIIIEIESTANI